MICAKFQNYLTTEEKIINKQDFMRFVFKSVLYGSAEGPPRGVENRNLLSHPDDLRMEAYVIQMT